MIAPTLETMRELGYHRAIVFHGKNGPGTKGMDEMSTLGPTTIMELDRKGSISSYFITPEMMGIRLAREEDLLTSGDRESEALRLLRILGGGGGRVEQDIVCLNASPILYMMGRADSLRNGVERARSILENGRGLRKLQDWTRSQSADPAIGASKLQGLIARAGIPA